MQPFFKKIFFYVLFVVAAKANAQQQIDTLQKGKKLDVLFAERMNIRKIDSGGQFISYAGNVRLKQGKTLFNADSIVLNEKENTIEAFGKVQINDADSVQTYADYLKYIGNIKKAYLKKNVKLTDGKGILTTNDLEYDLNTKIGTYLNGGKVVNGKTVLTSKEGYYYGETRDIYFKNKVVLIDPGYKINTDTLLYNTYSNVANFVTTTKIVTNDRKIKTKDGYYDLKNKKAYFGKRPEIEDSTSILKANEMNFDDSTGISIFKGDVVYKGKDPSGGYDLITNRLETNSKKSSFIATETPILLIKQGRDSVFIRADTLKSAKLSDFLKNRKVPNLRDSMTGKNAFVTAQAKDTANDKYFEAHAHVRIFSDSLQAIGDSLFYTLQDSVFRLFKSPVVWAQENQINGDTIYLFMENRKPQRIKVFENAMAINLVGKGYYNQLAGKTLNAFFVDGKINYMRCKGNPAQSIYYGVDDKGKFFGVNKAGADLIDMYFSDNKPGRVVFRNKLEGTTYPMGQVNHNELKLRGFKWLVEKRPKSKFEILTN